MDEESDKSLSKTDRKTLFSLEEAQKSSMRMNSALRNYEFGFDVPKGVTKTIAEKEKTSVGSWEVEQHNYNAQQKRPLAISAPSAANKKRAKRKTVVEEIAALVSSPKSPKGPAKVQPIGNIASKKDTKNKSKATKSHVRSLKHEAKVDEFESADIDVTPTISWCPKGISSTDYMLTHFFALESSDGNRVTVKCQLCTTNKKISCVKGNNSNMKIHLKGVHKERYDAMMEDIELMKTEAEESSRSNIEKDLLRFIVNERLPIRLVESVHLQRLIETCIGGKVPSEKSNIFSRKTAGRRICAEFDSMVAGMKETFKTINHFSATCDLWSRDNRSYIAINVHHIDEESAEMKSALIACERFEGRHNYLTLANKLISIFSRYELQNKIVAITTDNAAEFKLALKRFGDNYESYKPLLNDREDPWIWYDDENEEIVTEDDAEWAIPISELVRNDVMSLDIVRGETEPTLEADFVLHEMPVMNLDNNEELELSLQLPIRVACSAHTLNLVGKTDSYYALTDEKYSETYCKVFEKLNKIWSTFCNSRLNSELFEKYLHKKLLKPHRIRWNRIYDAVSNILSFDQTTLAAVCMTVHIDPLEDIDIEFLTEYVAAIKPIAKGLVLLEGSKQHFGAYLPMLFGIRKQLRQMKLNGHFKQCTPLLDAVTEGFEKRFGNLMDPFESESIPLFLAMLSNPKYKMSFIPLKEIRASHIAKIKAIFINGAEKYVEECEKAKNRDEKNTCKQDTKEEDGDSLLVAYSNDDILQREFGGSQAVANEISNFLKSPTNENWHEMDKYPTIKALFFKYNCIFTSEADVERVFSYTGMIMTPKRRRLKDDTFEKLIMLHMNHF